MEAGAGGSRSSMVVIRFDDSELDALRTESSAPDAEDMSEIRVSNVEPEEDPSEDCEEESEEMEAEAGEVAGEEGAGRDGGEAAPVSAEMLDVFDSSSPLPSASGVGVHVDVLRGLASIHGRVAHARFAAPPHVLAAPRWRRIELRKVWAAKLVQERWGRRRHYRTLLAHKSQRYVPTHAGRLADSRRMPAHAEMVDSVADSWSSASAGSGPTAARSTKGAAIAGAAASGADACCWSDTKMSSKAHAPGLVGRGGEDQPSCHHPK